MSSCTAAECMYVRKEENNMYLSLREEEKEDEVYSWERANRVKVYYNRVKVHYRSSCAAVAQLKGWKSFFRVAKTLESELKGWKCTIVGWKYTVNRVVPELRTEGVKVFLQNELKLLRASWECDSCTIKVWNCAIDRVVPQLLSACHQH